MTTGGSTLAAIEALQEEGRTIVGVVSVLDRLAGGGERIEHAAGAPYVPLATIDDVYPGPPGPPSAVERAGLRRGRVELGPRQVALRRRVDAVLAQPVAVLARRLGPVDDDDPRHLGGGELELAVGLRVGDAADLRPRDRRPQRARAAREAGQRRARPTPPARRARRGSSFVKRLNASTTGRPVGLRIVSRIAMPSSRKRLRAASTVTRHSAAPGAGTARCPGRASRRSGRSPGGPSPPRRVPA